MDQSSHFIDVALVDADTIVYLSGFGAERVSYKLFPTDDTTVEPLFVGSYRKELDAVIEELGLEEYVVTREMETDPIEYALQKCKLILEKIQSHTGCKRMQLYLSGSDNFRKDIATYRKYKGNRDLSKRPQWYDAIRNYMIQYWGANVIKGQEADDILGITQCALNAEGTSSIICSTDKDLMQIPGLHYNISKEEIIEQDAQSGLNIFYTQCLTGDSTDNIVGCPGIGPKKAAAILEDADDPWQAIVKGYQEQFNKKCPDDIEFDGEEILRYTHWNGEDTVVKTVGEFALEMARLVYIRQKPEEVWSP